MKHFTPDEANDALEVVRPLTERLVERRLVLVRAQGELKHVRTKAAGNGGGLDPETVNAAQASADAALAGVEDALAALDELGVQVKDLDRGLIDFPAIHPESGDVVLLCWHLGEDEVGFWHDLEEGFAGRKQLPF